MDYTVLQKILEKDDVEPKKIWKFFGAKTQQEMEQFIVDNLKLINITMDDSYIYLAPDMIYKNTVEQNHNVFYEKLMTISFFLRGFASYNDDMIVAFSKSIGMIKFVFLAENTLKENIYYQLLKESYQEYKKDKYFREQTSTVLQLFEEIANQVENMDLTETRKILDEAKTIQEK